MGGGMGMGMGVEKPLVALASGSCAPHKQTRMAAHQSGGWGAGARLNRSFRCTSLLLTSARADK